jgi:hypothetical protein
MPLVFTPSLVAVLFLRMHHAFALEHIRFLNASSISSKLGSSFIFENTLHHFIVNQYRFTLKK